MFIKIFCFYNRLTLSFTGNDDTNLEKQVLYLKETLKISDALEKAIIKPFSIKKEGIIIPSDIAYASKGGYLLETSKITPLASNIISLAYLWNVVKSTRWGLWYRFSIACFRIYMLLFLS